MINIRSESPITISELLDKTVRGKLNEELLPYILREKEMGRVLKVINGQPIMDNSAQMDAYAWLLVNAQRRGLKKASEIPRDREGD